MKAGEATCHEGHTWQAEGDDPRCPTCGGHAKFVSGTQNGTYFADIEDSTRVECDALEAARVGARKSFFQRT
jgi:hypothetical protein